MYSPRLTPSLASMTKLNASPRVKMEPALPRVKMEPALQSRLCQLINDAEVTTSTSKMPLDFAELLRMSESFLSHRQYLFTSTHC